ncbi:DHHW family protein [Butyrivibrio sp. WCE2006]|uniref:DHHW family protein n=1 Tax=Butyrivibrio sp. WCE2006 TaxID=1410611 RepID=UPI000679DF11|nr:DHHW family protein [Butyrivibrio sp. WCE2006]
MTKRDFEEKNSDAYKNEKVTWQDRVLSYIICAIMLCFIICFFCFEKRDFSVNENRPLSKFPVLKFENVKSGQFTEGLEKYAADHFPFRDTLMALMAETQRISGRKEINGVYLANDGSLIEKYDEPRNTGKQIEQFSKLAENVENADVMLMLVPTAIEVCSDKLPANVPQNQKDAQQQVIGRIYDAVPEKLQTIDALATLKNAYEKTVKGTGDILSAIPQKANEESFSGTDGDQGLFYRTDHHWTVYGAYAGYKAYCSAKGIAEVPIDEYDLKIVSDSFKGTIFSKLNDNYFGSDIITSVNHPAWKLKVEYSDTGEVTDTIYNEEYLKEKDQYSYFLNNIHPMVTITNDAVESGALALVKDSYANSMVPYLLAHYHKIYIFDTRYYKGGPSKFINEHDDITDVLILYNMNTIDNDTGIGGIY